MGEEGKRRSGRVKAARGKWKGVEGWKMRREIKEKARVGKGMKGFETPSTYWHLKGPLARVLARHFHQEMALERNCNHRTKKKEGSLAPNQRGDIKINGTKRARFSSIRESIGGGEPAREEGREKGDERDREGRRKGERKGRGRGEGERVKTRREGEGGGGR